MFFGTIIEKGKYYFYIKERDTLVSIEQFVLEGDEGFDWIPTVYL